MELETNDSIQRIVGIPVNEASLIANCGRDRGMPVKLLQHLNRYFIP